MLTELTPNTIAILGMYTTFFMFPPNDHLESGKFNVLARMIEACAKHNTGYRGVVKVRVSSNYNEL
jgi:hypothetical protein